jgi:ribosomal protein S18 acetylase RimI-like enzyme
VSEVVVRPIGGAHEHAEVGCITVAAYAAEGFLPPDDPYEAQLADVRARAAGAEVWVAELDDRLVGTVTWCPDGSSYRELATSADQGEFRMLAVDPQVRRRGVARALVDACLERAHRDGAREVVLCSLPEMTKAHALYRSLGFRRAPELDWEPRAGSDELAAAGTTVTVEPIVLWGFRLPLHP